VPRSCLLRIRSGAGHGLRRHAISIEPDRVPGWDIAELTFTDSGWWSEQLASFGADVVVLEPTDLRDAVIGRLKGVLA
jgi:proteasome accessory factor B